MPTNSDDPILTAERHTQLWDMGMRTIKELEAPEGILASGRDEVFGCIFGRDSLITSLLLLKVYSITNDPYLVSLVRKILVNLAKVQGTKVNLESGEEPGKCIHEFRPSGHEHLTQHPTQPWYVYEDSIMRNYDTVDATPLFLMACKEYYDRSQDELFLQEVMPNIRAAISWLSIYGDSNGDGLIDYRFHGDRRFGGLLVQSWMDSSESLFFEDSPDHPAYPIAAVEVQAYAYAAFIGWGSHFSTEDVQYATMLWDQAQKLKETFNAKLVSSSERFMLAAGIDGNDKLLNAVRSSMGHCLWAAPIISGNDLPQGILNTEYPAHLAERLLQPDLFIPEAGIRTLSSNSSHFEVNSYHNGSIWPHDTYIVAEGLEKFGYTNEASRIRTALLSTYEHFDTPLELFVYGPNGFEEYRGPNGQGACRTQAWSAAALLATLAVSKK
jgi:glycogen debranching enzyme